MSKQTPAATGSVGIVAPRIQRFDEALELACGRVLPSWELVYETYGTLNEDRSNAVLICHALSGNHHAAVRRGVPRAQGRDVLARETLLRDVL